MPRSLKSRTDSGARKISSLELRAARHKGEVYFVRQANLQRLAQRPSFLSYIRQLWGRRFFIIADAKAKALRSTRDYRLWKMWLVLNPLVDVALYGLLFGILFKTSRGVPNFIGYLFIGIIFMRMAMSLLTSGSGLLAASRSMIRAFPFPRASLVFSQVIRQFIDNLLPAFVALATALALQWREPISWTIILVVPLMVLIHVFGAGLMFIAARLTAEIPDVQVIIGLISQAWFFFSGVMFTLDRFDHVPTLQMLMSYNPGYVFLTAIRDCAIYASIPDVHTWATLFAWSFGTFFIGFVYFWHAEGKYVRIV